MAISGVKYNTLEDVDGKEMGSMSSSGEIDSDYGDYNGLSNSTERTWCYQQPSVRRNKWTVLLVHLMLFVGIGSIVAGLVLEIIFHAGMADIFRGFVFFAVGGLLLLPSVYALLHIYLAAKRIGRVRFSSVWFFTS